MKRFVPACLASLLPVSALAADTDKKGMPQLDPTSYASQLFWLAVFFVLFYVFMSGVAMPRLRRIIASRQSRIATDLGQATADAAEAEKLKIELDTRMNTARDQARSVIAKATEAAREEATRQDTALTADLTKRIETAEAAITAARTQAMAAVNDIATGMVDAIVPKLAAIHLGGSEARDAVIMTSRTGA